MDHGGSIAAVGSGESDRPARAAYDGSSVFQDVEKSRGSDFTDRNMEERVHSGSESDKSLEISRSKFEVEAASDSGRVGGEAAVQFLLQPEGLLNEDGRAARPVSGVLMNSSALNGGADSGVKAKAKKGLTCPHCGTLGIHGMSKMLLHVERMHSKPYSCNICSVSFVDRFHYDLHSPTCFFMCPMEGCNFQDKRESRLKGHLRRHSYI